MMQGIGEGTILAGKYRLDRCIGVGAMGAVWVAENLSIEAKVAVKLLHATLSEDEDAVRRFEQEAKAAARIRHRNIVRVFDLGRAEDGSPFIVMELMEGESFERLLQRKVRVPARDVLGVVVPVLSALSVAHAEGIVHRDLKPENIFLSVDTDGSTTPKIVDFGVSKMSTIDQQLKMTRSGVVVGTPVYMPPEQARGKDVDARADIWAIGVVMYEALSGQLPFEAENYNTLVASLLTQDARPLTLVCRDVDPELGALVMRALRRDREERYPSAESFAAELGAWCLRHGLSVPPPAPQVALSTILAPKEAAMLPRHRLPPGPPARAPISDRPANVPPRARPWWTVAGIVTAAVAAGGFAFFLARVTAGNETSDALPPSAERAAVSAPVAAAPPPVLVTPPPVVVAPPAVAPTLPGPAPIPAPAPIPPPATHAVAIAPDAGTHPASVAAVVLADAASRAPVSAGEASHVRAAAHRPIRVPISGTVRRPPRLPENPGF